MGEMREKEMRVREREGNIKRKRHAVLSRLKGRTLAYLVKCRGEFVHGEFTVLASLTLGDRRAAE